jgi:hypothetical protein
VDDRTGGNSRSIDHADLPRTHIHRLGKRVGGTMDEGEDRPRPEAVSQFGSEHFVMPDACPSPPAAAHRAWSRRGRSVRLQAGDRGDGRRLVTQ